MGRPASVVRVPPQPDEPCTEEFRFSALASRLNGSTAGELIPELARHGLQQLIMLDLAGTTTQLMIKVGEECPVLLANWDQVKAIS